jgi:hypothetical protein
MSIFDEMFDNLVSNIQYFTGIPVYNKKQIDEIYYQIVTKIKPIIERKLLEKARLQNPGKNLKVNVEITRLEIFEPPKWSHALTYERSLCYGIKIMEELFACLKAHDVRPSDGVNFDGLRKMQRELIEEYNRVKQAQRKAEEEEDE